jgi:hypothetical protein
VKAVKIILHHKLPYIFIIIPQQRRFRDIWVRA